MVTLFNVGWDSEGSTLTDNVEKHKLDTTVVWRVENYFMSNRLFGAIREIVPVVVVAAGVTVAFTFAAAFFDGSRQVSAEEMTSRVISAMPSGPDHQVLTVKEWAVELTAPLAEAMPLMQYSMESSSSVGLSSTDLLELGPNCKASRNALGALLRVPAGSYSQYTNADGRLQYIKTLGEYDFAYQAPLNSCMDTAAGREIVRREKSVLYEALSSLAVTRK